MLTLSSRLCPNEAEVAAKVMDGEAILINLSNGIYYSMDEVGGFIWERIAAGHSLGDVASAVARSYNVPPERARGDVERIAAELLKESLVLVADSDAPAGAAPPEAAEQGAPYATPELQKYSDMADLLALDPPMPGVMDFPWQEPSGKASG